MKSKTSIKKKSKLQKTKNRKVNYNKLSKLSLIFGAVVLIGATAPLWYMWADKASREEFMGFTNLRRFLFAFGSHFTSFCLAAFVFWMKNFIDPKYKRVVKLANIVGGVFIAISTYFLLWVFNPRSDFPQYIYEIIFIISALLITYGIYSFNEFIVHVTLDKRYNIRNLLAFIVRVRTDHYKKVATKAYYAEINDKAMAADETVEDNANEFEEDLYDTLEKIDNYEALEKSNINLQK